MNPEEVLARMARDLNTKVSITGRPAATGKVTWRVFVAQPGSERPIAGIDGCGPTVFSAMSKYLTAMQGITIPTSDRGSYKVPAEMAV